MKTYKRIGAVTTAVQIIKYLSDQREPVSAAVVAEGTNIQYATLMCHLVTLEDAGIVRQVGDHWQLGTGMALLWARSKARTEAQQHNINNLLSALG
jgi:DNA-binding IclR family transcriptional regulator